MSMRTTWLPVLLSVSSFGAVAQEVATPTAPESLHCVPASRDCGKYKHMLTYPAHALSYTNSAAFVLHPRGVNWVTNSGAMSLTLRRPKDYKGGNVRLTLFHQVLDDGDGDIRFAVTPITFNHGNSFETYGSVGSNTLPAPMTPSILLQQSAVIPPGNGWNADGNWWYLEITRQGSFTGGLRLMSVSVEY